jgi:hypothetical protein
MPYLQRGSEETAVLENKSKNTQPAIAIIHSTRLLPSLRTYSWCVADFFIRFFLVMNDVKEFQIRSHQFHSLPKLFAYINYTVEQRVCVQLLNFAKSPSAKLSIHSPAAVRIVQMSGECGMCFFRLNYTAPYMPRVVLILHLHGGEWGAAATGVKHNSRLLLLLSHTTFTSAARARADAGLQCNLQPHAFPPLAS